MMSTLKQDLLKLYQKMAAEGKLVSAALLAEYYGVSGGGLGRNNWQPGRGGAAGGDP